MSEAIRTEKLGDLSIKIFQDEDPCDPREDDNLGTMVCFHRRYTLGDKDHGFKETEDLDAKLKEKGVLSLPLYMMDHSGLTIRTDPSGFQACDSAGWDWGKLGYIFVEPTNIRECYGVKRITKKIREQALACLNAEIETYNQFIQGDVYYYVVEDEKGNTLDSCGGMFGIEYCLEEAMSAAKNIAEDLVGSGAGI